MRGRKLLLVVVALAIGSLGASLLGGWLQPGRKSRAERRAELEELVISQSDDVSRLQSQTDDARDSIYRAIELLTDMLNTGRQPSTAGQAIQSQDEVVTRFEEALQAKQSLPNLTGQITSTASSSQVKALELREYRRDPRRQNCLELLSEAMGVMVQAQKALGELDSQLISGFALYEDLFMRTKEWFGKQAHGDFRTAKQSADWYTVRTEDLLIPIQRFRVDIAPLEGKATEAGVRAKAAFSEVENVSVTVNC